jgi:hypothetical protein
VANWFAAAGADSARTTAVAALPRETLVAAVRWSLAEFAARVPGHSTEVRVPPFAAVQCLPGPRHSRGTPSNVVEMDPDIWLGLVTGCLIWADAVASGKLRASGERCDLSAFLPLSLPFLHP